jgi:hypothetical protein
MKTIIDVERRPFRYVNALIFVILIGVLGGLSQVNLMAQYLFKIIAFVVAPILITAGFNFNQRTKKARPVDLVEEIAIGVYIPEDERDQIIKTEAAMAAFRLMMLICWIVASVILVISKDFSAVHETLFWFAIILSAVGVGTFRHVMHKNGIVLGDIKRLRAEEKKA